MASDNLNQLGKRLKNTRNSINNSSRYISKNLPLIEETVDIFGTINPFRFEFKTYYGEHVSLNLIIKKKFKSV